MNIEEDGMDETLLCTACHHNVTSTDDRNTHYRSEWHRYNIKRRCAGMPSLSIEVFNSKLDQLQSQVGKEKVNSDCKICNKTFANPTAYERHVASKGHQKKIDKSNYKKTNPKPEINNVDVKMDIVDKKINDDNVLGNQTDDASAMENDKTQNNNKISEDGDEGDENVEDTFDWENTAGVPLGTCLFCNKVSPTLKSSLKHMLKKHGFFIPFIELLRDLEGLMIYLGEKVGIGKVCLHCNGRGRASFSTVRALQQHMIDKCHCKIRFEEDADRDEGEFLEFYDFPEDELQYVGEGDEDDAMSDGEMVDGTMAVSSEGGAKKKQEKGISDINDIGELMMKDGSIIGHRDHKVIYNQRVLPENSVRSDLVRTMMGEYKQLGLAGDRKDKQTDIQYKWMIKANRVKWKTNEKANHQKHYLDPNMPSH